MSLLLFIAILVVLIWVHELGHFGAAKLFGIRVDEFAIGFPPRLLRVQWGETTYTFNLLLLGGFVRIHGENPSAEASKGEPGPAGSDARSMANKPRPVQALVLAAGVLMNLLFGWLALSAGFMAGTQVGGDYAGLGEVRDRAVTIVYVMPQSPAARAGIEPGDVIMRVTSGSGELAPAVGSKGAQVQEFIGAHQEENLIFTISRKGAEQSLLVKPEAGLVEGKKAVGVVMDDVGILQLPPHLALVEGAGAAYTMTVRTAEGLFGFVGQALRGAAHWADVSGPVGIVSAGASAVREGFAAAAALTALISINLAIINLLPIPGLDGGRLLILAIEGALRRPLSARIVNGVSLAGLALVIALMLLVTYHDIAKLVG